MSKTLSSELGKNHILVNVIGPGCYGTADEYGRLAAFLCSEANSYISGQTILLDGGMTKAY